MKTTRSLLAAGLACALLAPSAAAGQNRASEDVADKLRDPMTQFKVSGVLVAMSEAMLDVPVDPVVRAVKSAGLDAPDLPPDATVRDLAGPRAGAMQQQIAVQVPRMMTAMGKMAEAAGTMMPELEAAARRMRDAVPDY